MEDRFFSIEFFNEEGLEVLNSDGKISMKVSTHKEIKAIEFERYDGKKL